MAATTAVTIPVIPAAAPVVATAGAELMPEGQCLALSAGAAVLYGVNFPSKSVNSAKYLALFGDGATVAFTSTDYEELDAVDVQTTITAANCLRVVVLVNGVPIIRVGSGATAGAGEFKVAGTTTKTLTLGSTYNAGTKIEVLVLDADDIDTHDALTAGIATSEVAQDIMGAGVAAAGLFI